MTGVVEISTFWTLSLILGGLLLVGLMRALRHLIEQLPISHARRETLRRFLPLGEIIIGLLYVLVSVPIILDHDPTTTPIVTASRRNSQTMSPLLAPIAFLMPISRVLSVTAVAMVLSMESPPTTSAITALPTTITFRTTRL